MCDEVCWAARHKENRECYARMERELDEAIKLLVEQPIHYVVPYDVSRCTYGGNAAVEGDLWSSALDFDEPEAA